MSSDHHRRVKQLFLRASELDAGRRSAFLEALSRKDAGLAREVRDLLDVADEAFPELEIVDAVRSALGDGPDRGTTPLPRQIGGFRILREIGSGGMGSVYEALQENPRRRVALKVITPGLATAGLLRRFDQECQILGRLSHPGIAQIYEAGTAATDVGIRPYFAMELIEGEPLDVFARERSLDVRQRLDLMARICNAVQHAHERGIVHRDLKPANVIVSRQGEPKVVDFGVAKLTDSYLQMSSAGTVEGQILGTLPYMSPEQVAADSSGVDARTDVYSLGVILYRLLTGEMPYEVKGRSFVEVTRAIRRERPRRPGALDSRLRGDVERIVLHALEKDPELRYRTAGELEADIHRYLDDEPVRAPSSGVIEQAGAVVRRHRRLAGVVGAVVLLLAILLAASLWRLLLARADLEATRRQVAVLASWLDVTERAEEALVRTVSRELVPRPGGRSAALEVLEGVRVGLETLDRVETSDRGASLRLRRRLGRLADAFLELGALSSARETLDRLERQLLAAGAGAATGSAYRIELSGLYERFGRLKWLEGDLDGAGTLYERALATAVGSALHLARLRERLARVEIRRDRPAEALRQWELARELRTARLAARPEGFEERALLASNEELGAELALEPPPDRERAVALLGRAVASWSRALANVAAADTTGGAPRRDDALSRLAVALGRQGEVLLELDRLDEAESVLRRGLSIAEGLVADRPERTDRVRSLARIWSRLADLARRRGDLAAVRSILEEKVVSSLERLLPSQPDDSACLETLARAHERLAELAAEPGGDGSRTLRSCREAVALRETLSSLDPAALAPQCALLAAHVRLAEALARGGPDGAVADEPTVAMRRTRRLVEAVLADHVDEPAAVRAAASALARLGGLAAGRGEELDARRWTGQAIGLRRRLATGAEATVADLGAYVRILLECEPRSLRDPPAALEAARRAAEVADSSDPGALATLALALAAAGQARRAVEVQRAAIARLSPGVSALRERFERDLLGYERAVARDPSSRGRTAPEVEEDTGGAGASPGPGRP